MKENELEFSDWPMFDLLMTIEELCRELLEVVLNAPVSNIEYIIAENDIRPTLTNHGVRLDAYVKTENEVCNIEMQTVKRAKLGRRLRFYQGAMDTLALRRGEHYGNLPPCYIVFICLHDPFNAGLPVRLRNLLHYISTGEAGDDRFATKLAAAVRAANGDEAWRKEKMALLTFEEDMEIQRRMLEEDREDLETLRRMLEEDREDLEARRRMVEEQRRTLEEQQRMLEEQRRMLQEDLEKLEHIAVETTESEGRAEGLEEGEARLGALVTALIESGRSEEVALVATDAAARRARFEEFGL